MAEHLPVHKAELDKLASFICVIQNPQVKQVAEEQYMIMQNHIKVMIGLMNSNENETIDVNDLHQWEPAQLNCQNVSPGMTQENILIELIASAQTMANKNFNSGLRMKAENVRNIHVHMALQQMMILNRYLALKDKLLKDTAPQSTLEKQTKTFEEFKRMFEK